jgi:hypothetical protein
MDSISCNRPANRKKVAPVASKPRRVSAVLANPARLVPKLSDDEASFLSAITASGQFTVQQTLGMYQNVRPLRNAK